MSKFLPAENIEYRTKLSKEEVIRMLQDNIELQKSFGFWDNHTIYSKPYIGVVTDQYFKVTRAINYRNSFLPEIKGEIVQDGGSTRIKVTMKPVSFVIAFMIVWFGGTLMACIAVIFAALTREFNPAFLIPFVMLVFGVILVLVGFKKESKRSIDDLKDILRADIVKR